MSIEPEILTKFVEAEPLFPHRLEIRRGRRIATYYLHGIDELDVKAQSSASTAKTGVK